MCGFLFTLSLESKRNNHSLFVSISTHIFYVIPIISSNVSVYIFLFVSLVFFLLLSQFIFVRLSTSLYTHACPMYILRMQINNITVWVFSVFSTGTPHSMYPIHYYHFVCNNFFLSFISKCVIVVCAAFFFVHCLPFSSVHHKLKIYSKALRCNICVHIIHRNTVHGEYAIPQTEWLTYIYMFVYKIYLIPSQRDKK